LLIKQLFDLDSSTYTYLIASGRGREGIIIDPVDKQVGVYQKLIDELKLELVMAIDTHTHADHVSGRCQLRHKSFCKAVVGDQSKAECVSLRLKEGEDIPLDGLSITPLYTPGHTDDSYSLVIENYVFTGDALFVRGTGRTDFQNGDPEALYDSITQKLFKLPESTIVYPAHDYNGNTSSSIYEEIHYNPRVSGKSKAEFVRIMNDLSLPKPGKIDVAVPANLACRKMEYGLD
jgi:sulfur dioxygenase